MPVGVPVKPPPGFFTVDQALAQEPDTIVNVIGVVSNVLPIQPSGGTGMLFAHLQLTIHVQDTSVTSTLGQGRQLRVKWFITRAEDAPKIHHIGDTVILRTLKYWCRGSTQLLLWNYRSECIVFPSNAIPEPNSKDYYVSGERLPCSRLPPRASLPTPAQQVWAITLRHALPPMCATDMNSFVDPRAPESLKKFSLIKDIQPGNFYDLLVEVVRMYLHGGEIYVTDYTEHDLLYHYKYLDPSRDIDLGKNADVYGYPPNKELLGPFGKKILQVKVWDSHAKLALRDVVVGEVVELRNVHVKMDNLGATIEGAMHEDRHFKDRMNTSVVKSGYAHTDGRVRELNQRKKQHLNATGNQALHAQGQGKPTRKRRLEEKRAMERERKLAMLRLEGQVSHHQHGSIMNIHVKCERPSDPIMRLSEIEATRRLCTTLSGVDYTLPFINAAYRGRVRVVDFWPDDLLDFSKSLDDAAYNDVCEDDPTQCFTSCTQLTRNNPRWEWCFYLLVEDAEQRPGGEDSIRVPLLVFDKEAECLLRLDATDLREDRKTLGRLREKLFILWGNLAELKGGGVNPLEKDVASKRANTGFDCCIKETGVETASEPSHAPAEAAKLGYQQIYHLYGTTIHD